VTLLGYVCLALSLVLLVAARGRYMVQAEAERGPFWRSATYATLGVVLAVVALVLILQPGGPLIH
jgi:hypothetical protein